MAVIYFYKVVDIDFVFEYTISTFKTLMITL